MTDAPPAAARRFYERAWAEPVEDGYALRLDGRTARTPGRRPLLVPTAALGHAIADEWSAQGATIDSATLPLTRLANTTIDGVAAEAASVRDELVRYAGSDLVVYRAAEPETLVAAQREAWDPVLAWALDALGARFVLGDGVIFVEQPEETTLRLRRAIGDHASPFALAALHVMTTLTGSVLIALMHASGSLTADGAWRAAHADEFFQESRWGLDEEAARRRSVRRAEFDAASRLLALARPS